MERHYWTKFVKKFLSTNFRIILCQFSENPGYVLAVSPAICMVNCLLAGLARAVPKSENNSALYLFASLYV